MGVRFRMNKRKINLCSEVLWYDGDGNYIMLDFNPYGMTKKQIVNKAVRELQRKFSGLERRHILETLYLLPDNSLINLK